MHDGLTIAVPTLAVIFAALLNRSEVQSLRNEFHAFRSEVREEFRAVRAEAREDSLQVHGELVAVRERVARVEERIGIQAAAG